MTSRNDITGDKIQTKPTTKEYTDNYNKIFGKKKKLPPACDNYGRCNCTLNQQYRRIFNSHTKKEVCCLPKEGRSL